MRWWRSWSTCTGRPGEHPDWAEFRQAMVDQRRLVATLTATHAYGQLGR